MAAAPEAVLDGAVFAFCTKMHNQIRLLLWDRGGYWLLTRKVYRGFFIWPETFEDRESIQACYEQLRVLLEDSRALKREALQTCRELENSVTEKV
jgi:transposase